MDNIKFTITITHHETHVIDASQIRNPARSLTAFFTNEHGDTFTLSFKSLPYFKQCLNEFLKSGGWQRNKLSQIIIKQ